jgi:HSP20 family protein
MDNGMTTTDRERANGRTSANGLPTIRSTSAPPVDVYENDDEILVMADVPGARADAVTVKVEKDELYISALRQADPEGRLVAGGRWDAEYRRSFVVPRGTDSAAITAELNQGVLKVHLPKTAAVKPRVIEVKAAR